VYLCEQEELKLEKQAVLAMRKQADEYQTSIELEERGIASTAERASRHAVFSEGVPVSRATSSHSERLSMEESGFSGVSSRSGVSSGVESSMERLGLEGRKGRKAGKLRARKKP
jgi:hypothetical protein